MTTSTAVSWVSSHEAPPAADTARACDYGNGCAEFYDDIYAPAARIAIDRLVMLADGGAVLEAGVGTGRYALPLAARGIQVHGIDASPAMLGVLRRKAGNAPIATTLGDFSTIRMRAKYRLVVCLTNTLALLPDTDSQSQAIACFADALDDRGAVLVETTHSPNHSGIVRTDVLLDTPRGARRYRVACRDVAPDTLDHWAGRAGLRCVARWRDWHGTPWNHEHRNVLSLYRKTT